MSLLDWLSPQGFPSRRVGSHQPLLLDDPLQGLVVRSGWLDLFLVPRLDGARLGARFPWIRVPQGELAVGLGASDGWSWLAVGGPETELLTLDAATLQRLPVERLAESIERWIERLSEPLPPDPDAAVPHLLQPGERWSGVGAVRSAEPGGWLFCSGGLTPQRPTLQLGPPDSPTPLVPSARALSWQAPAGGVVETRQSAEVLAQSDGWQALQRFHQRLTRAAVACAQERQRQRNERLHQQPERDQSVLTGSLAQLASVLPGTGWVHLPGQAPSDPLLSAASLVGEAMGITIRRPTGGHLLSAEPVSDLASASRCRVRACELEGRWWRSDSGPLLAFRHDGSPVALLSPRPGRYLAIDPVTRQAVPVTESVAGELQERAWMFYRSLPDRPLGPWDVLRFGLASTQGGLWSILWLGIGIGLLSLVTPVAIGWLVNTLIPAGNEHALGDLALALLAATLGTGAFNLTRAIVVLRMEGRMDGAVQSAIIDRVLRLPVPFFRAYSTGDLANRALGVNAIRSILSGATISTLMSSIFSLFSFALLFYYDWHLALVATGLVLFLALQIAVVGVLVLRYQRPLADLEGHLGGRVYQLLSGISKIRVAGAEVRAFSQWSTLFARQRHLSFQNGMLGVYSSAFQSSYKMLTTAVLFGFLAWRGYDSMNTGHFLAFHAAFGQFLGALTSVSSTLTSVLRVGPIMDRARPILTSPLETLDDKPDAGALRGDVRLNRVSFRYDEEAPWVFQEISLQANAGEFIAIVGPSGAGKSTLLRLLLGFDRPKHGTVLYDDQDLNAINLPSLRRQIGVVLQNGNLMPGDIYSNIVGSTGLSLDDAWEAARIAGIEADIQAMPMGMHTVIPEGASTISGGQRQRLMIARAIVTRPRVLLFDEATSALDAETQHQLSQRIAALNTTRVVIAHRLSTIRKADRIYVLANHRIVQSGTFEELMAQPGEFAELARRQMT